MTPSAAALSLALLLSSAACLHADTSSCPPSCENVVCEGSNDGSEVCVLQPVTCVRAPCFALPTCIANPCVRTFCAEPGTVCVTVLRPDNQFISGCHPRARPKPGRFCPPPQQVSDANINLCEYDNDCASDLLCCPGASRGGRNCTAPLCPDPCKCPLFAPTCTVVGGNAVCLDRVCQPGTYFCSNGKQTYCSDAAVIVNTNLPC